MTRTLIVIPARMAATRLPGKPMVDIAGEPDDRARVAPRRRRAGGPRRRSDRCRRDRRGRAGRRRRSRDDAPRSRLGLRPHLRGRAPRRPGGAGRSSSSTCRATCRRWSRISFARVSRRCASAGTDIATLAAEIVEPEERTNPNVVKVVGSPLPGTPAACAPSTSRAPPRPTARARSITTSASTRTGARRCSASWRCSPPRSSCARSSSSCARSKPACAST